MTQPRLTPDESTVPDPGAAMAGALAQALLGVPDMATLVERLVDEGSQRAPGAELVVVWSLDWPSERAHYPAVALSAEEEALIERAARVAPGDPNGDDAHVVYAVQGVSGECAVLLARNAGTPALRDALGVFFLAAAPFVTSVLEREHLRRAVLWAQKAERLQRALFAIADTASSDLEMTDMLRQIHQIVAGLMYAENFYIALHDPVRDTIRFAYFADVNDSNWQDPTAEESMEEDLKQGLTWYLIRDGKPLMGSTEEMRRQVSGPLRTLGPESVDWLGVPMHNGPVVRGALVVQSYKEHERYTAEDRTLLEFVASHILTALERRQVREELERGVLERTHALTLEVQERKRGERLQAALFQIAELASSASNLDEFFAAVHAVVGELLESRNFYIALLSDDRSMLHFVYWVDERDPRPAPRTPGKGVTEYVLRTGKPFLADMNDPVMIQRVTELHERGELSKAGASATVCWLGVPLICAERTVGVLVVQSYSPEKRYTARDQELLTFVSYQVANSLERKRAAEALKLANVELEKRVIARTAELIRQIAERERMEVALQQRNSELESLNQKLAGAQSQLLQSEKMASVGLLAAGVAHEINNPIAYVHSNLDSLRRYIEDIFALLRVYRQFENTLPEDHPERIQLEAIKRSIDLKFLLDDTGQLLAESLEGITRVEKIVRDLKEFSHQDEAEWEVVDIHQGIESTLNVVAHELKYRADVVKHYGQLPPIRCLPFQLNQVFMNLLVNAAHAMETRGTITIRTDCDDEYVRLSFSDTGKGIESTNLGRIFEPFFTTKPVGVGTGLGLSVAYGIVQKHGGSIDVASAVGKGTTFTLCLPINGGPEKPQMETAASRANDPAQPS
ncbi:GAF domain-containing protein [Tahibacter amnicola]|uniref:histidine kinase n=1 Tax=Tahibacter amnicola TaxID=2976241 RepID=A0ABY6BKQ7_9GAMM|nr:GAF domain-containing protein [Tahibacter amnicola]UXI68965.1 GAF domain-containing protein [Tahibacter amnicola]